MQQLFVNNIMQNEQNDKCIFGAFLSQNKF